MAAGVPVALGADDPLLTGTRLADQYRTARDVHGIDDAGLARLAAESVGASTATPARRAALVDGIAAWAQARPDTDAVTAAVPATGVGPRR